MTPSSAESVEVLDSLDRFEVALDFGIKEIFPSNKRKPPDLELFSTKMPEDTAFRAIRIHENVD